MVQEGCNNKFDFFLCADKFHGCDSYQYVQAFIFIISRKTQALFLY